LKDIVITRVRPVGYIHDAAFDPVTTALNNALHNKGHRTSVCFNKFSEEGLNIVIGAHLLDDPESLLQKENVVVYNFEQFDTKSNWFNSSYVSLLKNKPYWDYSKTNIEALRKVYPEAKATHVPFAYDSSLDYTYVARDVFRVKPKDIDVLFFGSMNDRRAKVLDKIKSMGLNVQAVFGVYGPELSVLIHRSKLVLNMHYYDSSVFEAVRVIPLLASRVPVVSEKSIDDNDYSYLGPPFGIQITDYDNLAYCCKLLIENENARTVLAAQGNVNVKFKTMTQSLESVGDIL